MVTITENDIYYPGHNQSFAATVLGEHRGTPLRYELHIDSSYISQSNCSVKMFTQTTMAWTTLWELPISDIKAAGEAPLGMEQYEDQVIEFLQVMADLLYRKVEEIDAIMKGDLA